MSPKFSTKVLLLALAGASCGGRAGIETLGPDQLYTQGESAFGRRKWSDAILAFSSFSLRFPTHARVQEARYRLGEAYFAKKEYITAAGEFDRLANDFPA